MMERESHLFHLQAYWVIGRKTELQNCIRIFKKTQEWHFMRCSNYGMMYGLSKRIDHQQDQMMLRELVMA